MADDTQKPLNLKKSFLKKGNEEEPIIVAQRFLNIFRQLHIFTAERKEAFNTMILELPPEIRGMFGSLPGGSILQEYVDDLEQSSGVSRDKTSGISNEISEEISKAKILATALAEAQIAAAAKAQAQSPTPSPEPIRQERERPKSQETQTAKSDRIVADSSFAKEIASAVKEAIMYTEASRRKETDEITKALASSQAKLAQMVMQNNSAAASSSSNNNANNIQINTAATFPPIEEMVSGIVRAQSELFREMAKTQTAELSAIISVALKESQQLSSQTIVEAIKAFQKENLKILSLRAATRNFEEDEIIPPAKPKQKKTEPKEIIEEPIEEVKETSPIIEEIQEEIEDVLTEVQEPSVEEEEETPKKKKKKKKKKKNKLATEDLSLISPSIPSPEKYEYVVAKNIDEGSLKSSEDNDEWEWEYEEVPIDELSNDVSGGNLDISLFDSEVSEPENYNKNLDLSIFSNEAPKLAENKTTSEDEFEWEEVEVEEETTSEPTIEAEAKAETLSPPTEDELEWVWEEVEVEEETSAKPIIETKDVATTDVAEDELEWEYETIEETIEEAPDPTDNIILAEEAENISTIKFEIETDDELEQNDSEEETISSQTSNLAINKFGFSNKEDEFDTFSLDIDKSTIELNLDEELEATEDDDFDFNEAEIETPTKEILKTENTTAEEQEWEWEYEAVEEEVLVEPIQAIETVAINEIKAQEVEEDWEWEYEEVEEEAPIEPIQAIEAVNINEAEAQEEEEEWEWEYEEVEEEAPIEPIRAIETEAEKDVNQNNLTNSFALTDPYQNLIPDTKSPTGEDVMSTNLSAIYTGEVYFQEDVLSDEKSKAKETTELGSLIEAEIGIPELNKDDNNEPYKPKII